MTNQKRILFVDDDRDFLSVQAAILTAEGYQVLTAESAEEALRLLEKETPDLIFLDLMLEHFDSGFTLSHKIRKKERFRHVPLIMLSAVASATGKRFDQEKEGLKSWSKLDGFLDKPVSSKELLRLVEEKLGPAAGGKPAGEH